MYVTSGYVVTVSAVVGDLHTGLHKDDTHKSGRFFSL